MRGITNEGARLTLDGTPVPVSADGGFRAKLTPHQGPWAAVFAVTPSGGVPTTFTAQLSYAAQETASGTRLARVRAGTFDLFEKGSGSSYTGIIEWAPYQPLTSWLSFQPHLGTAFPSAQGEGVFLALMVDATFCVEGLFDLPNLSYALGGGAETWTAQTRTFPYGRATVSWQLDHPALGFLDGFWASDALAFPSGDPAIHQLQVGIGASW